MKKRGKSKRNSFPSGKNNTVVIIIVILLILLAIVLINKDIIFGQGQVVVDVPSCIDSDVDSNYRDGINPEVTGEIRLGKASLRDYCHPRKNMVIEHYCSGGVIETVEVDCENGCKLGRCRSYPI